MSAHQGTTREGPPPISCHKKCYPLHDEFGVFGFASCGEQLQPCDFGPNCYAWCFDCEARQSAIDPARVPQGVSNDVSNAASRNESEVDGKRVVATAAGRSHTVALVEGGEAWAWGSNSLNELGDGTNTKRSAPVKVGLPDKKVLAIAAGRFHTIALVEGGEVWAWGCNSSDNFARQLLPSVGGG